MATRAERRRIVLAVRERVTGSKSVGRRSKKQRAGGTVIQILGTPFAVEIKPES